MHENNKDLRIWKINGTNYIEMTKRALEAADLEARIRDKFEEADPAAQIRE